MRLRGSAYAVTTAGLVAATLFAGPAAAFAAWDADAGAAIAGARAGELPAVGMPSITAHGSSVTVDWPALKVASGVAVRGYRVLRRNALTGETAAAERGCSGLLTTTRCTEGGVPAGHWAYEVTALVGDSWRSAPGVAAPTTIARPAVVTPLPTPTTPAPDPTPTAPHPTTPASDPAPSMPPTSVPVPSAPTTTAPTRPTTTAPTRPTTPAEPSTPAPAEPATSAPSHPVSKPSPSGPAPSSKPIGPAPTVSPAPSAEPTDAPAPLTKRGTSELPAAPGNSADSVEPPH